MSIHAPLSSAAVKTSEEVGLSHTSFDEQVVVRCMVLSAKRSELYGRSAQASTRFYLCHRDLLL